MNRGHLYIGTSNVVIPGNKASFPPAFSHKTRLAYYASLFNTVEVNSTFRKIPRAATLAKWCCEVGPDFRFTLKINKEITHVKKLEAEPGLLEPFLQATSGIDSKKGCLLIQFPASITSEYREKVRLIVETLEELDHSNNWCKAFEFRHASWYTSETYRLLFNSKCSMVLQDMPRSNNLVVAQQFPFYYFRYHGPAGDYRGSYTNEYLKMQAQRISGLLVSGKDVYVYFNNTMGNAFENALLLKKLLEH